MNKLILFSILFLFSSFASFACSCGGPRNFCATLNSDFFSRQTGTVLRGIKLSQDTIRTTKRPLPFMYVKIIDVLIGTKTHDTVIVFGGDGLNCNHSLRLFDDKDTMILAFDELKDSMDLTFCAHHYLHIKNGNVTGNIISSTTKTTMPYDSFLIFLQSNPCLTANIFENQQLKNYITVVPNPGNGSFNINFSHPVINAGLKIYNSEGKFILSDIISADANSPYPIDLVTQPKGLYYIRITDGFQEMSTRILKY